MEDQESVSAAAEDQSWFRTAAWQSKEAEVDQALGRGERGEVFGSGQDFLRSLADEAGLDLREIERRTEDRGPADT
ncbi:hypothetical protein [Kitasatospora sp. NPDC057541]|uniref:hypothetical protein n=1 Tax=unclassified Kitasatospora TaxID=2633591 RepID=UPI0036AAC2D9